jgi:hypothetical protein
VLLAETSLLPVSLYATLPFWPLLGAILVGLMVALRLKPERAHWPVVLGAALSALLGVLLFLDLGQQHAATGPEPAVQHAAQPHGADRRRSGPQPRPPPSGRLHVHALRLDEFRPAGSAAKAAAGCPSTSISTA